MGKFKEYLKEREDIEFDFLSLLEGTGAAKDFRVIAKELGDITHVGAFKALKRALDKIYYGIRSENKELSPVDVFSVMAHALKIDNQAQLFKDLKPVIQDEIKNDAKKKLGRDD